MEAIFDSNGKVVGWLKDNLILNTQSQYVGFINSQSVYSMSARHLGTFSHGFFRDKLGHSVSFVKNASNGPITPVPSIPPIPAIPPIAPILPIPPIAPIPPISSLSWSKLRWLEYLSQ